MDIQNIMITIIEVLCCKIFFEIFCNKRITYPCVGASLVFIYVILGNLILKLCAGSLIWKQTLLIVLISALMFIFYSANIKKIFVLAVLFQSSLLVIDYLSFVFICALFPELKNIKMVQSTIGILIIVFGKICLLCLIIIIKKKRKIELEIDMTEIEWLRFILFPIFSIFIIISMFFLFNYVDDIIQANLLCIIAVGLVGMNIMIYYMITDILKREAIVRRSNVLELQLKNQADMYQSMAYNFEKQKRKAHEFKNQIRCMEEMIKNKSYSELKQLMLTVENGLNREMDAIETNHAVVNAIVNIKYREALEKDILFIVKINDLSELKTKIMDEDIITILSNLLNNAIEACEHCTEEKIIKLKFLQEESDIVISVKNTYKNLIIEKDGIFKTTKDLKEEHGFGIQNIKDIIDKYKGFYIIQYDNCEFYFSIVIPI